MNLQNLEVFQGADTTLTLYARDASNAVQNLTGLTINWVVGRRPTDPENRSPVFTKTGTIVSAPAGTFTVTVAAADTADMQGEYVHQAETTDSGGNIAVVTIGRLNIRSTMLAS